MSTSPAPVSVATATTELHKISQYLKAHEKLVIIVLFLVAGVHFYSKVINAWEQHEQTVATAAHAALQAQDDKDKALAAANAQSAAQYQQLAAQLAASNAALAKAQAARDTATKNQQIIDRTLPPSELATRWTGLLGLDPQTVQVEPGGKGVPDALVITPEGARTTVVQLEELPTLRADLKDEQAVVSNQATQLGSLASLNVGLNKQIDGLNIDAGLAAKACTDDKNLLKAQARKSKLKWFVGGYVAGLITRGAVKVFSGI